MKDKVMDALQRFSKAMFIPVLILPIAGILIAVGNLFTNVRLQAVLPFLNNPVTIGFGTLLSGSLNAILGNLGVIFCVGLSVGLANKKKSEAGFISLLAFLVFLNAMNKFMNMRGMLVEGSLSGTGPGHGPGCPGAGHGRVHRPAAGHCGGLCTQPLLRD